MTTLIGVWTMWHGRLATGTNMQLEQLLSARKQPSFQFHFFSKMMTLMTWTRSLIWKFFLFLSGYFNRRFSARFLGHFSINYWKRIWDESHSFPGNISLGSNCSLSIYNQLFNIWNILKLHFDVWYDKRSSESNTKFLQVEEVKGRLMSLIRLFVIKCRSIHV